MNQYKHIEEHVSTSPTSKTSKTMSSSTSSGRSSPSKMALSSSSSQEPSSGGGGSHYHQRSSAQQQYSHHRSSSGKRLSSTAGGASADQQHIPSVRDFWLPPKRGSGSGRKKVSPHHQGAATTTTASNSAASSSLLSPSTRDTAHRSGSRRSSSHRPPPVRPEPDPDGFLVSAAAANSGSFSPSSTLPSNFSKQQQSSMSSSYLQQRHQMHSFPKHHQQFTHHVNHPSNNYWNNSTPATAASSSSNSHNRKTMPTAPRQRRRPKKNRPWLQDNTNNKNYNSSLRQHSSGSISSGLNNNSGIGSSSGSMRPQYQVGRRSREAWKNLIGGGQPPKTSTRTYSSLNTPQRKSGGKSTSLSHHLQTQNQSHHHQQHQPYDEAFGLLSSEGLNVVQEEDDESSTEAYDNDKILRSASSHHSKNSNSSSKNSSKHKRNQRSSTSSSNDSHRVTTKALTSETAMPMEESPTGEDSRITPKARNFAATPTTPTILQSPTDEEPASQTDEDDNNNSSQNLNGSGSSDILAPTDLLSRSSDIVTLASLGDAGTDTEDDEMNNLSLTSLDSNTGGGTTKKRRDRSKGVQRSFSNSSDDISHSTSSRGSMDHAHRIVQRGRELAATLQANYKREQQQRKEEQMLIYKLQREQQERLRQEDEEEEGNVGQFSLYKDDDDGDDASETPNKGENEQGEKQQKPTETPQSMLINGLKQRLSVVYQGDEHVIEEQGQGRRFLRKKSAAEIAEAADREVRQRRRVVLHSLLQERLKRVYQGHHYIVEAQGRSDNVDSILDRRRRKQEQEERDARAALLRMQLAIALQDRLMAQEQREAAEAAKRPKLVKKPPEEVQPENGQPIVDGAPMEDDIDEDGEIQDDEDDDVSVLSMGEQSVATVQSLIVAATILNHQKSQEFTNHPPHHHVDGDESSPIDLVETAQAAALRNTRTQQKQQMQQFLQENNNDQHVDDDEQSEWDEQTYYSQQQHSTPQRDLIDDDEQSEWDEMTYHSKMTQQLPVAQHASTDDDDDDDEDDDDRTEWDEYTYHSKMTQQLPPPGAQGGGGGALDQFLRNGGSPQTAQTPTNKNKNTEGDVVEWSPRKQMAGSNTRNRNPLSESTVTLPHSNRNLAQDSPGDKSDIAEPPQRPTWTASAAESVAEALLSLPGTLLDLPKRTQSGGRPPPNLPDGASYYDEETLHDYEDATYYDDCEGGEDDDYWDDHTIATVADAFVTLPKNIQMEFLLSSRNASEAAKEHDDDDSSKPFEEDEPVKELDKNNLMSSTNTSSTASDSWHHDAKSATGSEGIQSFCSSASLEDLLHKDLIRPDTLFVEGTMRELSRKVKDDAEYRASVVKAGGILALVRSMEHNVANPDIQIHACQVLESLARDDNADNKHKLAIADLGGVEAVIGALANYMELTSLAEAACACLLILLVEDGDKAPDQSARDEQKEKEEQQQQPETVLSVLNIEVAVVDVLVSCMKLHPKNVKVQQCNFRILTRLCLDDKEKLIALSQFEGFVIMSASLSTHWDKAALKQEAIMSLSTLFAKLATYQAAGEL